MKLSEVFYFPYSRAQHHFEQAEHSEWKGRFVHRIVGALEYIPLLNYLIALVDLVVQPLFRSNQPPASQQPKVPDPEQPKVSESQQFLKDHNIKLQNTLLSTIDEIESDIGEWGGVKGASDVYWTSRINPLRNHIKKLEGKVDKGELLPIKDKYRGKTEEAVKDFKALLNELKGKEENRILPALQADFADLTFQQPPTFDELMASMGFSDNKVQIDGGEWSFGKIKEYGLQYFADFNSIGLFDFEEDYRTARRFEAVVKHIPEAQKDYESFLRAFEEKVSAWEHRTYAPVPISQFNSAQEILQFIQETQPLLLMAYLSQPNLNQFWETFSPSRSLASYLLENHLKPSPFELGFQIEES